MAARSAEEKGFGLLELVFAMVLLNVGILALMGAFQSGALALGRSAATSNGTAVADKVIEAYRDLPNCAIYLHANGATGTDSVTTGLPDGIPNSTSSWYATYSGDAGAYGDLSYFDYSNPTAKASSATSFVQTWATEYTLTNDTTYFPIPAYTDSGCGVPSSVTIDPHAAVQKVTGPDGQSYPVLTYITIAQAVDGSGTATAGFVKQVTVTVLNPQAPTQALAHETSLFDPTSAPPSS